MSSIMIRYRRMSYLDQGDGFPILFGHSFLFDKQSWSSQVEDLSKSFRCIVPDLWSHGGADEIPQKPYSLELLAEDYHHLMHLLDIDEYAVVGTSIGGMWGAHLAISHPKQVKALVLMDTFLGEEPQEKKNLYLSLLKKVEEDRKFTDQMLEDIVPFFFSKTSCQSNPELVETFKQKLKSVPVDRLNGMLEIGNTVFNRQSLLHKLSDIKQPVMILVGEDDIPRPIPESKQMADKIPHAQLHIIKNAGHMACLEQPKEVNERLVTFFLKSA